MGLFSWLFGGRTKERTERTEDALPQTETSFASPFRTTVRASVKWRDGSFPMGVVGESSYQSELISVVGPYRSDGYDTEMWATIELEPTNPLDQNAVAVKINGRKVGYLERDQALRVGAQMREDGIDTSRCRARIRGGWQTSNLELGLFGVRLAIPAWGWIDFGVGRFPPVKAKKKPNTESGPKRAAIVENGPLSGENIALMGAKSTGEIAEELASLGARVMSGVGKTTTMLVVVEDRPFSPGAIGSASFRKANELSASGSDIRIVSLSEVRALAQRNKETKHGNT